MISLYRNYKKNDLQDNLKNFLKEIVPVAEDNNVKWQFTQMILQYPYLEY